ncbi:hypothetical protein FRC08_017613 [Ceratobasidium sp. 394]|nr:hypothetical protein FRC08_017613 [Ceratobasidium sp. 394]
MSSVQFISRIKPVRLDTLPRSANIRPPPGAAIPRKSIPTVVDILAARNVGGGLANLRVEEFKDEKRQWHGVKRDMRKDLKRVIKEK